MNDVLSAPTSKPETATDIPKLAAIPQNLQRRFETDKEVKAFIDEKQLLTRLPISRRTVFNWIQQGKLPVVKIGRRKIFHWASVEAALLRLQRGCNAL